MTSLPKIQNRLRKEFGELCEACFSEQEWLEEGDSFNPEEAKHDPADCREAAGTSSATPTGP
jgi:hypothetical protein